MLVLKTSNFQRETIRPIAKALLAISLGSYVAFRNFVSEELCRGNLTLFD